jgi:hypothetical protein
VSDNLEFNDGDCAVIIKEDGSIGRVVMPSVNRKMIASEGYRKLLDVLEVLQPGARDKMINYAEKGKRSMH